MTRGKRSFTLGSVVLRTADAVLRAPAKLGLVIALGFIGGDAFAGGLIIPGAGPIAEQRAGAAAAKADDPTALAVNPAGLAKLDGMTLFVGANFVDYSLSFQRRGTYDVDGFEGQAYAEATDVSKPAIGFGGFQAVPMISFAMDLSKQVKGLHVAAGLIAPTAYPTRDINSGYAFDENGAANQALPSPTRYDTVTQEAAIVLPSLGVAYHINDMFDVGARLSWGVSNIKGRTFVWGETNYDESPEGDAMFDVEAKDLFVPAFGLGVLARPIAKLEVGLNWESAIHAHNKGTGNPIASDGLAIGGEPVVITPPDDSRANCAPGGVEGALKACVDINLPMVTTLGVRYVLLEDAATGAERADVEADVSWERWGADTDNCTPNGEYCEPASDHHIVIDGEALGALPLNETFIRHGFKDTISLRLGGGYAIPVGANLIQLRGGFAWDSAAAKHGWERVDMDGAARHTITLGGSFVMNKLAIHLGGGFVHEGTREVGGLCNPTTGDPGCLADGEQSQVDRDGPDPAQPLNGGTPFESPFNAGTYSSHYVLLNLGVTAKF